MRFLVTKVQAKYKTYRYIHDDTLIFKARDYFSTWDEDPYMTALAWFYSGCIYRERKDYTEAMQQYKGAERFAQKTKSANLKGLVQYNMGDLLLEQGLHKKALECYREAALYYDTQPSKQAQCFSAVGRMYLFLQQPDSAFLYFHRGIEIAETVNDNRLLKLLTQNLSVAYLNTKQFTESEKYLRQSFQLNTDSTEMSRYYLNFAELYTTMGQPDSALWYTDLLKQHISAVKDDYFKASAYSYLAGWEKEQKNYDVAYAYQDAYINTLTQIMEMRESQSVYESNKRYDYEQMQKQHYMDLFIRQRWIFALSIAIIAGVVLFISYWIKQRNRKIEIQHNIDTLQEMNHELGSTVYQKQIDLRKSFLWRFDVARKVMEMNNKVKRSGKYTPENSFLIEWFNRIIYGEKNIDKQWEAMFQTFRDTQPGLAEKIRERYPDLTEAEFRVCILTYAGFRVKEIALILHQKPNTIQVRRTGIRRQMGLDLGGDIATHIDHL